MTPADREKAALARWKPGRRLYHPLMAFLVIRLSRFVMGTMNTLSIDGLERFDSLRERGGRGLLTFSNHVSIFDDPLLVSNFGPPDYDRVRWVAADAINFFGSPLKAWLFTAGKSVPIVRGSGLEQPGLLFLAERLREGGWVHVFPEGTRTRDPRALMASSLKPGIGRLMAEARPIALPFYHYGMQDVLPVGARLPRRGRTVRVLFGSPLDCSDSYIGEAASPARASQSPTAVWESLASRAHATLRDLELEVNPAARRDG
jgi:monolysocardiolipin acyltransferase